METLKSKLLDLAAKTAECVAKHEMAEWPPVCLGHYYQPERPQQEVSANSDNKKA